MKSKNLTLGTLEGRTSLDIHADNHFFVIYTYNIYAYFEWWGHSGGIIFIFHSEINSLTIKHDPTQAVLTQIVLV